MNKKLTKKLVINPHLKMLINAIESLNATPILVGGFVRDYLLDKPCIDIDIEVYGITSENLELELSKKFSVISAGKSFGVYKVIVDIAGDKKTFDVALPRTENKAGSGHRGFVIGTDPFLPFEKASLRRDFTINAMGIDIKNNLLLDPHNGEEDLKKGLLKHVSVAFAEDPLRVLRAAQFCARFNLTLHPDTLLLCRSLSKELFSLSKERIFVEMKKLLLSEKPSIGLSVLHETHALVLFPELFALVGCPQDALWHPEGDVWVHSLMVTDEAALLLKTSNFSEDEKLIIATAALCHDLGKPKTTVIKDGRIRSPAHEPAGQDVTVNFLSKIAFPKKYYDDVISLVVEHLKPHQLYRERDKISDSAIKRLSNRVNIERLLYVSKADFLGRTTQEALSRHDPSYEWLKEEAFKLSVINEKPKALILGRNLIEIGYKPGPLFSKILRDAFEAQLNGEFDDEISAKAWLKKNINKL